MEIGGGMIASTDGWVGCLDYFFLFIFLVSLYEVGDI